VGDGHNKVESDMEQHNEYEKSSAYSLDRAEATFDREVLKGLKKEAKGYAGQPGDRDTNQDSMASTTFEEVVNREIRD